jgi:hypothetical protein
MTPSGDGYPIDLAEEIIDLAGSFLEADRGSQCRAETQGELNLARTIWGLRERGRKAGEGRSPRRLN